MMRVVDLRRLLAIALVPLAGCSPRGHDRTISAVAENVAQEAFLTERAGMLEAASPRGLTIDWNGPDAANPQRQITLITQAARVRRYGIVVTPAGGAAIDTTLENALSRGVPVVLTRDATRLTRQPHLSFVLEDYSVGAHLVTERLGKIGATKGTVVILGVDNYSENSVRRLDAVETAIRRDCPHLTVARPIEAPFGSGYVQIAAEHALKLYPDLVSFVTLNARSGLGAEAAIEDRGMAHRIAVISFDDSLPLLLRLRRGYVDAIISQNMRGMGEQAIANLVADREGRPYPQIVTLPPILITRDNLDEQATQDWLQFNQDGPS
jgi:ABC-type sugar transport system substrate-binding protein